MLKDLSMREIFIVGIGGFIGSVFRFKVGAVALLLSPGTRFPLGTLLVNLVGCLLVGIVAALLEKISFHNDQLRLLLITGFLGGFTTFSAFGLETLSLLPGDSPSLAILNITANVVLGILSVWIGFRIAHYI